MTPPTDGWSDTPTTDGYHWLDCEQYGPDGYRYFLVRVVAAEETGTLWILRDNGHKMFVGYGRFEDARWHRCKPEQ